MKEVIKSILRIIFKDYQFNRIYYVDLSNTDKNNSNLITGISETIKIIESKEQFDSSQDERIRSHSWYLDQHAYVYGAYIEDELVCICAFWIPAHPRIPTRFSNIKADEAVMVDLLTASKHRGKGYALAIVSFAEHDLITKGYKRLWTWVWHSNIPSINTFKKAGWTYSHLLLEFRLNGMKDYVGFKLPARK